MIASSRYILSSRYRTTSSSRSFFALAEAYGRELNWKPSLLNHSDIEHALPWGLIDQNFVFERVMPCVTSQLSLSINEPVQNIADRINSLRSWMQTKTCESRVGNKYFQQAGTYHAEFTEGSKLAYQHIANLWSSGNSLDLDQMEIIAAPGLAKLLCQVHTTSREKHCVQPRLVLNSEQPILASVIKVEMEEGRAHKPGQIFDRWDKDDLWHEILLGAAGPEAQLMQQIESRNQSLLTGSDPNAHIPQRLVAHTLFLVKEKYEYKSMQEEGSNSVCKTHPGFGEHYAHDFRINAHVWEFETDVGMNNAGDAIDLHWRVRNINNALKPRSGMVLKSDGLVERRLGRWIY